MAILLQLLRLPDGTIKALVEGKRRVRVVRYVSDEEFFKAEADEIEEPSDLNHELKGLMHSVVTAFETYASRVGVSPDRARLVVMTSDASVLSDKIASHLDVVLAEKQGLLESISPTERLKKILSYMNAAN